MDGDGVIHERSVAVAMRDGVRLFADVRRPDTEQPVPVLLMRTPYNRALLAAGFPLDRMVEAGFGVVLQDCRGCFESEGQWSYVRGDVEDGYDTVEWAAREPWSNGRVGMFGPSYMGNTQWMAAISGAPQLEVIAPACCPADLWTGAFDTGGAFRLGLRVSWAAGLLASMASQWGIEDARLARLSAATLDLVIAEFNGDDETAADAASRARDVLEPLYGERPVGSSDLWQKRVAVVDELAEHESRSDSWWRRVAPSTYYGVLDLPALHVGGWYDIHLGGTLANFGGMRRQAPTSAGEGRAAPRRRALGPLAPGPHTVGGRGLRAGGRARRRRDGAGLVSPLAPGRARPGMGAGPDLRDGRERVARRAGVAARPDRVHSVVPPRRWRARCPATGRERQR